MDQNERDHKGRARKPPDRFSWHKRYHSEALVSMLGLTPEQRGVYNTIIDLCYARRGPLRDDDATVANSCNCDVRMYRRIKRELIALDRIKVDEDAGTIYDARAIAELVKAQVFSETQAKRARKSSKVVRLAVVRKGPSYGVATGLAKPEVPRQPLDNIQNGVSPKNRTESISNGGAAEPAKEPQEPNIQPLPARALEEQRRLLSAFVESERAETISDRKAKRRSDGE
ncbi:MAG: DUF1376 domain-containing protein [Hyphomonadaceae bacterium]|nr:DUF1376 domain-containing protein [Hyphomonadaceae bacterium]